MLFPCGNLIYKSYKDDSELYFCSWREIKNNNIQIKNWENNRPPDETRIPKILKKIRDFDYVDGIIYLAYNQQKNIYYCYDGIHRITSLTQLYTNNLNNPPNNIYINITNYDDITNIMNHNIILHIIPYDEDSIMMKFNMINKCIPVPEIYTKKDREQDIKNMLIKVIEYFMLNYKEYFTHSKHPNIPNENRDRMMDKLYSGVIERYHNDIGEKYTKYSKDNYKKLIDELLEFNTYRKANDVKVLRKLTSKQIEKCEKKAFYLFISKDWENSFYKFIHNNNSILI